MTSNSAHAIPYSDDCRHAPRMSVQPGRERLMSARYHLGRTAFAVLAALTAIGLCLTTAATAAANRNAVAAGHTISYVSPAGGSICTLGFAFTRAGRALGITAGHCVDDGSGYIIDTDSGYRGRVVSYAYDPSKKGSDFSLIDFGYAPVDTTLLDTTIAAFEAPPEDQTICHTGRFTGSTCGQLAYHYRWGAQYLTEGHGDRAGDSGGPVWTRYGLDELAIVGIWLGTHDDGNDTINGRFYPLPEALQNLGLASNPL
jgi:streptogrisin B